MSEREAHIYEAEEIKTDVEQIEEIPLDHAMDSPTDDEAS